MNNNRIWLIGSLLLSGAVLVAGWFIGISPLLEKATLADSSRAEVESQNAAQRSALVALEAEYAQLGQFQGELDSMRGLLPSEAELPDFLDKVNAVQVASGARVTNIAVSDAMPYLSVPAEEAPAEEVPAEDAPTTDEEATAAAAESADAVEATPVAVTAPAIPGAELVTGENFILIPISLAADGSLDQVMAFIGGMQRSDRLFTATDVVLEYDESKQLFSMTIEASIYVMPAIAPSAPIDDTNAATAGTIN